VGPQRADGVGAISPDVIIDKRHIDILAACFVLQPTRCTRKSPVSFDTGLI
jgi:hypothetical protein